MLITRPLFGKTETTSELSLCFFDEKIRSLPLLRVGHDMDYIFGRMTDTRSTVSETSHLRSNVENTENSWNIYLEVPGFSEDEVKIEVDRGVLSVSAEHEKNGDKSRFYSYSSVKRSWALPDTVDEDKIEAALKNGVLSLTLPKREEALPKKKEIKLLKS